MTEIPKGYCQCGCGGKTNLAPQDLTRLGWIKGEPIQYILGHSLNRGKGEYSHNWKGGSHKNQGYNFIYMPGHPRACSSRRNYVREHIVVVERVLGKPLTLKAVIHHIDENRSNNHPSNLVICEDRAYHKLLHYRMRAFKACGHANWMKCEYCHQYDAPGNMYVRKGRIGAYHSICVNKYQKEHRERNNK